MSHPTLPPPSGDPRPRGLRDVATGEIGRRGLEALNAFNARHPWSHNDHFHSWITSHLPDRRERALDVGCGRGELLGVLAPLLTEVAAIDADADMRTAARSRTATLPNVHVDDALLPDLVETGSGSFDLVTMIAVLHHLELEEALTQVRDLLRPGGKLLVVGLAAPRTARDMAWEAASIDEPVDRSGPAPVVGARNRRHPCRW
jgi:2-polyprenyl-3-methyl-5-hydroxy-6-metoxy-1,4-benzoquinol methylase